MHVRFRLLRRVPVRQTRQVAQSGIATFMSFLSGSCTRPAGIYEQPLSTIQPLQTSVASISPAIIALVCSAIMTFFPLPGTYVVAELDVEKTLASLADPLANAAASTIKPTKCIVYLNFVRPPPSQTPAPGVQ